jgi:hypothetical protein
VVVAAGHKHIAALRIVVTSAGTDTDTDTYTDTDTTAAAAAAAALELVWTPPARQDLVTDVGWAPGRPGTMVVVLGHAAVELWQWGGQAPFAVHVPRPQSLLYSAMVLPILLPPAAAAGDRTGAGSGGVGSGGTARSLPGGPRAVVAGGCVYSEVVLWAIADCNGGGSCDKSSTAAATATTAATAASDSVTTTSGGGSMALLPAAASVEVAPILCRMVGHQGVVFSIDCSGDGCWVATASDDRSVRVWWVRQPLFLHPRLG